MKNPTIKEVVAHLREHYSLPMSTVLSILRTPMHPRELRDEFAGRAMQAAATNPIGAEGFTFEERAKWAYQQADAMLAERAE